MRCDALRLLFVDICKNAGTAIIASFQKQFPNLTFEGKHHSIRNWVAVNQTDLRDDTGTLTKGICSVITDELLRTHRTFAVVRNPFDRLVSLYCWGFQWCYPSTFKEFVREVCKGTYTDYHGVRYKPQWEWLTDAQGIMRVQHLVRYERLQEDFPVLLKTLGLPPMKLLKTNAASKRTAYRDYYDAESRRWVEEHYKVDLQRLGYSF